MLVASPQLLKAQQDTGGFFKSFDSTRIYYEIHGKGRPVLLIHGFIVNGESWKQTEVYTDLIQKGYRVITLDLRGNGKSDRPHTETAYTNDAEARDIQGLISWMQIKEYDVVGYSRGSIIASRLMVLDKRVHKVVLGGMGADFTNPDWPRRIQFYQALAGDTVKALQDMVNYVRSNPTLDRQALTYLQKDQPSTSREELQKIRIPVMVICGNNDRDDGSGEELAHLIPHAVFTEVPGDHNQALHSQQFAEAVLKFFDPK